MPLEKYDCWVIFARVSKEKILNQYIFNGIFHFNED